MNACSKCVHNTPADACWQSETERIVSCLQAQHLLQRSWHVICTRLLSLIWWWWQCSKTARLCFLSTPRIVKTSKTSTNDCHCDTKSIVTDGSIIYHGEGLTLALRTFFARLRCASPPIVCNCCMARLDLVCRYIRDSATAIASLVQRNSKCVTPLPTLKLMASQLDDSMARWSSQAYVFKLSSSPCGATEMVECACHLELVYCDH